MWSDDDEPGSLLNKPNVKVAAASKPYAASCCGAAAAIQYLSSSDDEDALGAGASLAAKQPKQAAPSSPAAEEAARPNAAARSPPRPDYPTLSGVQVDHGAEAPAFYLDRKRGTELPANVNRYLRAYQRRGIKWMWKRYRKGLGYLLNDDMGLGKTVQIISLLCAVYRKTGYLSSDGAEMHDRLKRTSAAIGKYKVEAAMEAASESASRLAQSAAAEPRLSSLIVVPAAVLEQWEGELNKWGCFGVLKLDSAEDRREMMLELKFAMWEVVLMTYEKHTALSKELDRAKVKWELCVMDEVHQLKNPLSLKFRAFESLGTGVRIGLTGTAMQNDLMELYTLVSLVRKGWTGMDAKTFKNSFSVPISKVFKSGKNKMREQDRVVAKSRISELLKLLSPVVLRRDKSLVADEMPRKKSHAVFVDMAPAQAEAYRRVLALPEAAALLGMDEECDCGSPAGTMRKDCCGKTVPLGNLWQAQHVNEPPDGCKRCPSCLIFPLVHMLLKVANHPSLLADEPLAAARDAERRAQRERESKYDSSLKTMREMHPELSVGELQAVLQDNEEEKEDTGAAGTGTQQQQVFKKRLLVDIMGGEQAYERLFLTGAAGVVQRAAISAKLTVLGGLLDAWSTDGSKVLVFSQFLKSLDIVQGFLDERNVSTARYDGSMSAKSKVTALVRFKTDALVRVLLITTRAGGLGLNLTEASKVVLLDASWNPTYDLQAQDRAYRLGQKNDVTVYRLFAKHTIEELIYARQGVKTSLASAVTSTKGAKTSDAALTPDEAIVNELYGTASLLTWQEPSFADQPRSAEAEVEAPKPNAQAFSYAADDDEPDSDAEGAAPSRTGTLASSGAVEAAPSRTGPLGSKDGAVGAAASRTSTLASSSGAVGAAPSRSGALASSSGAVGAAPGRTGTLASRSALSAAAGGSGTVASSSAASATVRAASYYTGTRTEDPQPDTEDEAELGDELEAPRAAPAASKGEGPKRPAPPSGSDDDSDDLQIYTKNELRGRRATTRDERVAKDVAPARALIARKKKKERMFAAEAESDDGAD
jgi:SNF2 family DNA or RNA helicase